MTDVASHAGVSQTTVSRVLSNHPRIRLDTREAVLRAIEELGYKYEMNGLKNQRRSIGLFFCPLPEQGNPIGLDFYGRMLTEIQGEANLHNIELVIITLPADADSPDFENIEHLSGIILIGHPSPHLTEELFGRRIPFVTASGVYIECEGDIVTVDDFEAAVKACRYIISRGFANIGLMMTERDELRISGFRYEMMKNGIEPLKDSIRIVKNSDTSSFINCLHEWMSDSVLPDMLVISHCEAAKVIKSILNMDRSGRRKPELFSFNHKFGDNDIPCMQINPAAIAKKACRRLLEIMEEPDGIPHRIVVPMQLDAKDISSSK